MTQQDANAIAQLLEKEFAGRVELEDVGGGRYRFAIVSERFAAMSQLQRQDIAWSAVDGAISRDKSLDISLIVTLAPDEVEQKVAS